MVSDPWFELPLPAEWETRDGITTVTRTEKYVVRLRGTPSVIGTPADILKGMNEYDVHVNDMEREAMEEAKAGRG